MTIKQVILRVWREKTIIAAVATVIATELIPNLEDPSFTWKDGVVILVGIGLRFLTTPWPIDPTAKNLAGLRKEVITTAITLTCGHMPVDVQVELIRRDPRFNDGDCVLDVISENHEEIGQVGGFHINHGDCHPGRVDACITPPTLHSIMFYGPDLPHILSALLAYEGDFNRKDRIISKLRNHLPEALHNGL